MNEIISASKAALPRTNKTPRYCDSFFKKNHTLRSPRPAGVALALRALCRAEGHLKSALICRVRSFCG